MSDDTPDPLLAQLGELPPRRNTHDPAPAAREAFEDAFVPWHQRVFVRRPSLVVQNDGTTALAPTSLGARLARGVVPLFLAAVIAVYLMWAFSTVLALHGGGAG